MTCDVCKKETMMPDGIEMLGASILFKLENDCTPEVINFAQKQMGPYELNREYRICWECMLKAYGVKPQE